MDDLIMYSVILQSYSRSPYTALQGPISYINNLIIDMSFMEF